MLNLLNRLFTGIILCILFTLSLQAQEGGIPGGCQDGIDNDGDGLIDCLDSDCAGVVAECPAFDITSMCSPSGGIRGDVAGVETAFRNSAGTAVTFTIPPGATSALIYTSSTDINSDNSLLSVASEDFIISSSVLDLIELTSSGMITYAQSTATNSNGTTLFGWKDLPFGNKASTGAEAGHDYNTPTTPLNDITFSVSGNILTITEDNVDIKTSYLVEFISSSTNSLISEGFGSLALNAGTFTGNVEIPTGTDFIIMTGKGTGAKNHANPGGGTEEAFSDIRMVIDLTSSQADGYVSVINGGATEYHSTYAFEGHDISSTTDSLWDATTIVGDYTGKIRALDGSTSVANFVLYESGGAPNTIELRRDANYGADFDDVYVFEFFSRTGLPMASEFIESQLQFYEKGSASGSSETFSIPSGSNYAIFKMGGLAENANVEYNENPVNAYAFIDLEEQKAYGYYFQQVGFSGTSRRDHNYAFSEVPLDQTNTRTHTNTIGKTSASNQYDIRFELSADKTELTVYAYFGLVATSYKAVMIADFFGSRADIAFDASSMAVTESGSCPTVDVEIELCNPGGGHSPTGMPIAFYDGDPETDANAILLDVGTFNQAVEVGQCATETIEVDLSDLANKNINLTVIINDDGSFGSGFGNPIGSIFDIDTLDRQNKLFFECDYSNNLIVETISVNNCPVVDQDNATTEINKTVSIQVQDNDSDPDGDNLTTSILTDAQHGTTQIIDGDSIRYTPTPGYVGMDTIVYQLSDGNGGFDSDTIFITVSPALPVELASFTAVLQGCEVQLRWVSLTEENFDSYDLERSADGVRFEKIHTIDSQGTSNKTNYSHKDTAPYPKNYYRLKMIDQDKSYAYSSQLHVRSNCSSKNYIVLSPNPVVSGKPLNVNLYSSASKARLNIINITGQVVQSTLFQVREGLNTISLSIDALPQGTYYISDPTNASMTPTPFVKLK